MKPGYKEKKKAILQSATRVFSEKGFADATISEIAAGAGLTTSGIYVYYKNKDAIYFKIIENFLFKCHEGLKAHLQGIQGAENKLRKAIWFHCDAYTGNRDEIQIVLESRSNPRFYASNAYSVLKKYAGLMRDIIAEGIESGVFYGISSPVVLRDMIMGAVDHMSINWILKAGTGPADRAETIYDLVMSAVRPVRVDSIKENKKDIKRADIINAATSVFSQKGFNDSSMLEIAKMAGVAEGTVYEYFKNKENLLISIPCEKLTMLYDKVSGNSIEMRIRSIISNISEIILRIRISIELPLS